MSKWRNRALELFPELRLEIEKADSIVAVWCELTSKFQRLYDDEGRHHSRDSVRAIYLYAIWCLNSDSPEVKEAATTGFLESFAHFTRSVSRSMYPALIEDAVRNLGVAKLRSISGPLGYVLKPDQQEQLFKDFEQAETKLRRRK